MKTCLVCNAESKDDDAVTCPACGEGSWSETVKAPMLSEPPSARTAHKPPRKGN